MAPPQSPGGLLGCTERPLERGRRLGLVFVLLLPLPLPLPLGFRSFELLRRTPDLFLLLCERGREELLMLRASRLFPCLEFDLLILDILPLDVLADVERRLLTGRLLVGRDFSGPGRNG